MNKEWSELNKTLQLQLKKESSFKAGINTLFELRDELMKVILSFKNELERPDFNAIPFINANGYHNKTIAYSIWHIFRIEDIVAHSLVNEDEQIFFAKGYNKRINSPIITTGNELEKQQIADFSELLDLNELYSYANEVKVNTEKIVNSLRFDMLKNRIGSEQKEYLRSLNVVSCEESASWLIDYWCEKDIAGLIKMPFSRHWIMHIEASLRIKNKLDNQNHILDN